MPACVCNAHLRFRVSLQRYATDSSNGTQESAAAVGTLTTSGTIPLSAGEGVVFNPLHYPPMPFPLESMTRSKSPVHTVLGSGAEGEVVRDEMSGQGMVDRGEVPEKQRMQKSEEGIVAEKGNDMQDAVDARDTDVHESRQRHRDDGHNKKDSGSPTDITPIAIAALASAPATASVPTPTQNQTIQPAQAAVSSTITKATSEVSPSVR